MSLVPKDGNVLGDIIAGGEGVGLFRGFTGAE